MRICADQAPPPLTGTAAWSLYSLGASRGARVLSFWGAQVRVVTNVVNPRCFSCGFLPRCYERRQSEGFFADNGGILAWIDDVCHRGPREAIWSGLVLWTGCFEGCWLLLVVLCPLACVLVG